MPTILGWGKEISNAVKMYIEELKYNGINSSFNYKLTIFYNIYNQSNVPQEAYNKALLIILIGLALNQYFFYIFFLYPIYYTTYNIANAASRLWRYSLI